MRKNTHKKAFYYVYINGFDVFTAKPKLKWWRTWPETVPVIEACRKIIRDHHKYEEYKKLVERQVERIAGVLGGKIDVQKLILDEIKGTHK